MKCLKHTQREKKETNERRRRKYVRDKNTLRHVGMVVVDKRNIKIG